MLESGPNTSGLAGTRLNTEEATNEARRSGNQTRRSDIWLPASSHQHIKNRLEGHEWNHQLAQAIPPEEPQRSATTEYLSFFKSTLALQGFVSSRQKTPPKYWFRFGMGRYQKTLVTKIRHRFLTLYLEAYVQTTPLGASTISRPPFRSSGRCGQVAYGLMVDKSAAWP